MEESTRVQWANPFMPSGLFSCLDLDESNYRLTHCIHVDFFYVMFFSVPCYYDGHILHCDRRTELEKTALVALIMYVLCAPLFVFDIIFIVPCKTIYQLTKILSSQKQNITTAIQDKSGKSLTEDQDFLED